MTKGTGNKMHPVHPADKCKGPIRPVDKGASDEEHPVRSIDKSKGPAWPVNNDANGNQDGGVLDLQMYPFGGNMDKVCVVPGRLYQKLKPHQKEGLHWLWRLHCQHSGGIVADDMGMGKMLQTAVFLSGLLHSSIISRAMVIVPVSVLASWSKELTTAGLAKHIQIYHGSSGRGLGNVSKMGGILLTTYETYGSKYKVLTVVDWDYTILDEAHRIKNLTSNVRKQVDNIKCRNKLLLTGTPLPKDLLDIYSLMKFVKPDVLGDQHTFCKKYVRPIEQGQYLNSTERDKKQFIKALASCRNRISPYILRRTKSVLIDSGELPCKKTELIVWLRLTELQVEIYTRFFKLINQESHGWNDEDKATITHGVICRHICNGPELLIEAIDGGQGISVRRLAKRLLEPIGEEVCQNLKSSCKLSFILDLVNDLFEEKAEKEKDQGLKERKSLKILIFSQFISMLNRIEIALKSIRKESDIIRIDGSMTRVEREKKIEQFTSQAEDAPKIFLLSAKVGGEGLNLTAATKVVIVDPSWNISDDNQIADRVFRIGQKEDVIIYRLMTCMTIEEDIYKTQLIKGNLARAILEGKVCSPLTEYERDRKFIRLLEAGFKSSKTQELLETLMGDVIEMRSKHQNFTIK